MLGLRRIDITLRGYGGVDFLYCIPDILWDRIVPLLLPSSAHRRKRKKTGRPRMDNRKAMNANFYVLRTGCQWKALPRSLGASSTVHDRFQEWRKEGVFKHMWIDGLSLYNRNNRIDWKFCTPECCNAIQEYFEYRKRCGEDIAKDKSPLIREQFNIDDNIRIHSPRFMSDKGMEYLINQVLKRSGVRKPREVHMSHGFRISS